MNSIKTLIIYDQKGGIIRSCDANSQEPPTGVPYLIIDLPVGIIVDSINMETGLPNYSSSSVILSEIDKMNAKMDYIAMMSGISLYEINDVYGSMPQTISADEERHSENYVKVYNYYMTGLWSITAIRLAIDKKWITHEEYNSLVKTKMDKDSEVDTTNDIPVIHIPS